MKRFVGMAVKRIDLASVWSSSDPQRLGRTGIVFKMGLIGNMGYFMACEKLGSTFFGLGRDILSNSKVKADFKGR